MGNEATALIEHTKNIYSYNVVNTIQAIASTLQFITTTEVEHVALVVITLEFEHEGKASSVHHTQDRHSTQYYLEHIRTLVRKTDVVFLLNHTLYFLLLGANLQGGQIVQTRLWDALLWRIHNSDDIEVLRPHRMTIGHSTYSRTITQSDERVAECINAAHAARQIFAPSAEKTIRKVGTSQVNASESSSKEAELPTLARKLGIPYLALLPRNLPEYVQQLVRPSLAQELHCYPLGRERGTLTVAIANPQDRSALDRLQRETGLHIFPVLAPLQELQTALDQLIG